MKKHLLALLLVLFAFVSFAQQSEWESSIQQTFDEAKELYNKQLYNPAKSKFEQVLKSNISRHTRWAEESSYYRAMCALFLLNKDAEQLLEEFTLLYPTSPYEQKASFAAADYYFNKRNYKKAEEWFERVDRNSLNGESKAEYYFKLGYSQLMSKQREEAKLSFYQVKDSEAKYGASAKYYYAHIAYEDSNYVTALENFQPLLKDESFGPVVPYYLAQVYYKKGDYDKLLEYGEPLLAKATEKRKPEIAKLLGEAYLRKEEYKKAVEYLEFYKDNGGRMAKEDNYSLGYAYYKTGNYEDAIQVFNKISSTSGALAQNAHYHLGDCYLKTGNKSQALSAFKAASEGNENPTIKEDALFNYAKLNYELANPYGSAIEAFQSFLKEYPNSAKKVEANKYLANLYLTTKDYENALVAISNTGLDSKEMKEAYQKVSYFRGVQLFNGVELERARGYFDQSLKFPSNPTYVALAHFWKSESFYKQENYKAALEEISAFESTPGSYALTEFANARYNKAYCYFMLDDYANATTSFRLFLDNKKSDARKKQDAELRLGDAYFMQSKYATAITFYNKYLSYKPSDADYALFQKALCQGLDGKRNDKIMTLEKLVREYPTSKFAVDGLYEQGATLLTMDNNSSALAVFQDFVKKYPESKHTRRALLNIGVIYRNMDQDQKSIETFKKVVADYPSTPEANEAIAFSRLVYAKINRLDEYVEWVETIGFADIKRASLDSTMFNTGFDYYSTNNCTEAISAFNNYLKKFPDGLFFVQANYFLGECAYKAKKDDVAAPALERVINEPRSEYTERSISMLASIYYAGQDFTKALFYYEQLLSFSEEMAQLRKARLGAMRCAVKLDIPNKALQFADIILEDERTEPEVKSEAMLVRARSYWKLEDVDRAHEAYNNVKLQTKGESQAEAAYFISKIQNMRAEYEQSNTTIFWMIDNLPSYQKWRFQALLVLADNYYKTGDNFQANYTLDFIISENYNAEMVAAAKAMKEEIRRAEEQKDEMQKRRDDELNEQIIEINGNAPDEFEEENEGDIKNKN